MSDGARIEFGQPYEMILPEENMPPMVVGGLFQVPRESPFQVFFVERTLKAIEVHTRQSKDRECAGVMVGHPFRTPDDKTIFVIVTEAVPFVTPQAGRAHVLITPHASAQARQHIETHFPGQRAVGWYHSHPSLGVFLSADDSVITQSIYNADWHIALVLDPSSKNDAGKGVFRGPQQEQVGFLLIRDVPKTVRAMAAYNLAVELWGHDKRQEALSYFVDIQNMVDTETDGGELGLWRERGAYRDVKVYLDKAGYRQTDAPHQLPLAPATPPDAHADEIVVRLARLYTSGKDSAKQGDWPQAQRFFQEVARIDPAHVDVQDWLSLVEKHLDPPRPRKRSPLAALSDRLFGWRPGRPSRIESPSPVGSPNYTSDDPPPASRPELTPEDKPVPLPQPPEPAHLDVPRVTQPMPEPYSATRDDDFTTPVAHSKDVV